MRDRTNGSPTHFLRASPPLQAAEPGAGGRGTEVRRPSSQERCGRRHEPVSVIEPRKVTCVRLNDELGVREQSGKVGHDARNRVQIGLSGEQQHRSVERGECRAGGLRIVGALSAEGRCGILITPTGLGRLVGLCRRIPPAIEEGVAAADSISGRSRSTALQMMSPSAGVKC
jgi:hypothetical protein